MIFDHLDHARLYYDLHPHLRTGFEYLAKTDLAGLEIGKHALDGDRIFAVVAEYAPKSAAEGKYESHRKYWDLQYLVRGVEQISVTQSSKLKVSEPYDTAKDIMFYERSDGDLITLRAGMFAVFGPQDAHMPGLAAKDSDIVRKVVVKVQWSD